MIKVSNLSSPALVGVVKEKNAGIAIAEITNCLYSGADLIDLHLSCLEDTKLETLRKIFLSAKIPVLGVHYNILSDGTYLGHTEDERTALLLRAVKAGAAGIDMQGYTFDEKSQSGFFGEDKYSFTKGNPKEVVTDSIIIDKQCEFIESIHKLDAEVLLSCHPGIYMSADRVVELALFLEKRSPDIIKIVTVAENEDHLIESFRAMQMLKKEVKTPVAYHASGKAGRLSRIINPMLGGHLAFCVDRYKETSILEQPDLKTTKSITEGLKKIL